MNTNVSPLEIDDAQRFLSLTALRMVNNDLIKRYRELDNKSEMTNEIKSFIGKGQATGGLFSSEEERWAAQSILDYWASMLFRTGYDNIDSKLDEYDPNLAPELDNSLCPYLGLESFNEQKKNLFFGRQRLVYALLDKLKTSSLLAVIGSSGTGKSSVVLAGLLPYLKTGALPESENWHYYDRILPGSNPLKSLAQIICPSDANPNDWIPEAVAQFLQDSSYLTQVINRYSNSIPSVLVVDQFEEVFTLCQDKSVRQAFIDNLLGLVKSLALSHNVILTMRADFESQVVTLGDDFQTSYELAKVQVTYLGASELREAIEKPAELVGLKFEKGLIEALVNDVLGEPAALPLLQFTLLKLWDSRERNRITWDAYKRLSGGREVGGAREALQRIAEEFYNGLILEEQNAVKRILLRMVRPREGSDFTSNRVLDRSLYRSGEDDTLTKRVLEKLIAAGLVRSTKGASAEADQVEVAHEALVRNWQRLREWLEHDRKAIRERLHLTEAVEQWLAKNKETDLLWRGNQLAEALQYDDLNIIETEFVQCSKKIEQTEIAEQQKQVEEKIRLDEKITRKSKELVNALIAFLIISFLSALAIYNASEAEKAKLDAEKEKSNALASLNIKKLALADKKKVLEQQRQAYKKQEEAEKKNKELIEQLQQIQKEGDLTQNGSERLSKIIKQFNINQTNQPINIASKNEAEGFNALLAGNLENAKEYFGKAYDAYPVYHNVDEIYHQVLSQQRLENYKNTTDPSERGKILQSIFKDIIDKYAFGAPPNSIAQMRDRLEITIQYYLKSLNQAEAIASINELTSLGFNIEKSEALQLPESALNSIWFGSQVNTNTVKLVAEVLVKASVQIKSIRPFRDGSRDLNLIQVGADREIDQSCPTWNSESIQNRSEFTRENNGCS